MTRPGLGEDVIRALTTEESFSRGRDYFLNNAVSDLVRRANVVTGRVEGSQFAPYDVTIELLDGGVADTRCSCPYDWAAPASMSSPCS
ncbi:hypothetical protein [Aminobacter sp. MSH1]|uniref:SWIM zinc finger family protein n=1 Tax=Aminobacter sp. MSH1 TaxID=374606 RepID=UPI000D332A7A|nr:hypothetical protein [Aminobacter sp. MSH1]